MKLITFQHRDVLDKINKGIYKCNIKSEWQNVTPESYNVLRERLIEKSGNCDNPIFAWYKIFENSELEVNNETVKRALEMVPFNNYVLLELEVEDKYVDLQDFYTFVDMRCEEEGFDCYYETFEEFPKHKVFDISTAIEIQATIPMIKKEWIKSVYEYEKINKHDIKLNKVI